jgi:hypothetical protein
LQIETPFHYYQPSLLILQPDQNHRYKRSDRMRRTIGIVLIMGLTSFLVPLTARGETQKIPKVVISQMTKQQYLAMAAEGFDIVHTEGDEVELLAHPGDLTKLSAMGIPYSVTEPDLAAFYAARAATPFGGYRTFSQIVAFLDSLSTLYPSICSPRFSIGRTIEGRDQWVVRISNNPNVDQGKPSVFYNALIHAREPAGADALLAFMKYLVTNYGTDPTITNVIDNRELYFLPVVNPDGYVYNETNSPAGGGLWRKNRRSTGGGQYGIDLNRNFGFSFAYDDNGSSGQTSSETYRGSAAFSEPETQNIRDFVIAHNFTITHNIHTYSNLVLWPWGHDRIYTDRNDFYALLGDSLTKDNHYTPEISWTLYPTNGDADDWVWGDTVSKPRAITLTTEMGTDADGFWPDPSRIPAMEAENLSAELFLARIADHPYLIAPPNKPSPHVADSVGQSFKVTWNQTDTINPAVSYKLFELTGKKTVTDSAETDKGYWTNIRMVLSTARKHSGAYSWKTDNANNSQHWLVSKTPYLVRANDSLKFWMWYNVESNWDYFYAQVSIDGGHSFVNLANNLTTNTDPNNMNLGNGITGQSGAWVRAAFDLSPYVGRQVIVRLTLFTDSYSLNEGVYLDDIENIDLFSSQTQIAAGIVDTFYEFASKPVGTYWYALTATDLQGQESPLSDVVTTQVHQSYVVGDLNGNNFVDLADLSSLVAYLTTGAPVPNPMGRGNVNCIGIVDLGDLSYLVAYLTGGASKPSCP